MTAFERDRRRQPDDRGVRWGRRVGESAEDYLRVTQTMVQLLSALSKSPDVNDAMSMLAKVCAELVADADASIVVVDDAGALTLQAATSERQRAISNEQVLSGEGWAIDVFHSGEPALNMSLQGARERWPAIAALALQTGIQTVHSFPLRYHGEVVGVLELCDRKGYPLSELQVELLTVLAESAGVGIGNRRQQVGKEILAQQLQHALDSRVVIEQAKGVIVGRLGVTPDQAFNWLRRFARNRSRNLHDIAAKIVDGSLPAEVVRPEQ